MSTDIPRKRTRSQRKGTDLLKDAEDEEDVKTKKVILEGQDSREIRDIKQKETVRKITEQLKAVETVNALSEVDKDREDQDQPQTQNKRNKEKKKKKKSKEKGDHTDNQNKKEKDDNINRNKEKDNNKPAEDEPKEEEKEKKKFKKRKMLIEEDSQNEIKEEQKSKEKSGEQKSKKKEKKKKRKHSEEKREKSASKKKKHKKDKKQPPIPQVPKEENKTINQQNQHEEPPKERENSIEKQSLSNPSHGSEEQRVENSGGESSDETSQKQKKQGKKIEKKGRKPQYVKRKKESIFERQQIINKKWRIKKRSNYINKMSNRAWGDLRAGPYRNAPKITKEEQRKVIDTHFGDGPKDKMVREQQNEEPVKVETEPRAQDGDQEKMEEEVKEKVKPEKKKNSKRKSKKDTEQEEKPKSKSKPKKKKKKVEKNSEGEEQKQQKPKSKSKPKKKKKKQDEQVKEEQGTNAKKKSKGDNSQPEQQEAKLEEGVVAKPSKKKKKRQSSSQDASSHSSENKSQSKSKKKKSKVKTQDAPKKKQTRKAPKEEEIEFNKEESEKIISLFEVDGGNYPQMMKELPGVRLKKVRMHLRKLFHRALDIITYQVQHVCGRKIKEWQQDEKVEIVRELHRIRSSNRLLSEANAHFRQKMTALMRSYNDETMMETVNKNDIETLYRRLEAFVRGYNTINRSKRTTAASITESKNKEKEGRYKFSKDITRKPIISGGHLLSKGVKTEPKDEEEMRTRDAEDRIKNMQVPDKLVEEWNRNEEKSLCQLYVSNKEADQIICDTLKEKYGPSIKWRDFQLLGKKIDQLIKYALIKLQNLTARPYCRAERKAQMERKRAKIREKLKKEGQEQWLTFLKDKLDTTSMFAYDNEVFQKEEKLQFKHRIFKNLSLLERQVFGHIESYKFKSALIRILIEEFPPEEDIEMAVREAKAFSKWAREDERRNNISSIKSVFIGEREDYHSDNDSNDDSIMADIEKVKVCKSPDDMVGDSVDYKEESLIEKSELFGDVSRKGAQEDTAINIDDDDNEGLSDFEEPPEANSGEHEQQKQGGEGEQEQPQYKNLQRLYATLTTSNVSASKQPQK